MPTASKKQQRSFIREDAGGPPPPISGSVHQSSMGSNTTSSSLRKQLGLPSDISPNSTWEQTKRRLDLTLDLTICTPSLRRLSSAISARLFRWRRPSIIPVSGGELSKYCSGLRAGGGENEPVVLSRKSSSLIRPKDLSFS
jgi:hypothetical protein